MHTLPIGLKRGSEEQLWSVMMKNKIEINKSETDKRMRLFQVPLMELCNGLIYAPGMSSGDFGIICWALEHKVAAIEASS